MAFHGRQIKGTPLFSENATIGSLTKYHFEKDGQ
jgi:hypothetical protein